MPAWKLRTKLISIPSNRQWEEWEVESRDRISVAAGETRLPARTRLEVRVRTGATGRDRGDRAARNRSCFEARVPSTAPSPPHINFTLQ